jgi:microcystin-dependent protein
MADPFVAEMRFFGFGFAPSGWAQCNGQILSISQNTALFSLVGTTYGGNGTTTFALPNLQGAVPMAWGQGPGLSIRDLGEVGGAASVTLLQSEMPNHSHTVTAATTPLGTVAAPSSSVGYARPVTGNVYATTGTTTAMSTSTLAAVGSGQPHNNLQPYLVVNCCIALQGIFPSHP